MNWGTEVEVKMSRLLFFTEPKIRRVSEPSANWEWVIGNLVNITFFRSWDRGTLSDGGEERWSFRKKISMTVLGEALENAKVTEEVQTKWRYEIEVSDFQTFCCSVEVLICVSSSLFLIRYHCINMILHPLLVFRDTPDQRDRTVFNRVTALLIQQMLLIISNLIITTSFKEQLIQVVDRLHLFLKKKIRLIFFVSFPRDESRRTTGWFLKGCLISTALSLSSTFNRIILQFSAINNQHIPSQQFIKQKKTDEQVECSSVQVRRVDSVLCEVIVEMSIFHVGVFVVKYVDSQHEHTRDYHKAGGVLKLNVFKRLCGSEQTLLLPSGSLELGAVNNVHARFPGKNSYPCFFGWKSLIG